MHQNLEFYSSYILKVFTEGLLIFHYTDLYNILFLKNMAKMHIFKGNEFVSPLQQH